jgi:folate-dependent phosphoribosylglycinamide formyltransferase PurN
MVLDNFKKEQIMSAEQSRAEQSRAEQKFTFGFLTTIDSPLLPFMLSAALSNGCNDIVVICDERLSSKKDKRIWKERTGGSFERVDGGNASIYNLGNSMIPYYFVKDHNNEQTISIIKKTGIKCLFNAGTPRKLNSRIINICKHGIVNVHPGLLPEYRGCTAVEWAIYYDDKIGNTAHFMDEGYDTGSIITSEWYEFPTDTDYQSIRVRVYRDGCILAGKVLSSIKNSRMIPSDGILQDEERAKYWKPISDDKMEVVFGKIKESKYRYQSL